MITVRKGIVDLCKDGSMLIFPTGNHGPEGEYREFVDAPDFKSHGVSRLLAWPGLILEELKELEEKVENMNAFISIRCTERDYEEWLEDKGGE